jgi:hypothetical protein
MAAAPTAEGASVKEAEIELRAPTGRHQDVCVVCRAKASKHCGKCKQRSYCSIGCQKREWTLHRLVCGLPPLENSVVVKETERKGVGKGVFAARDVEAWSFLGVDRAYAAINGGKLEPGRDYEHLICTVVGLGNGDPLKWLTEHGFTLKRKNLPTHAHTVIARLAKRLKLTVETVEAVARILYEYQFIQSALYASRPLGVGLYRTACFINHSCEPNTKWIVMPGGECYLLCLRRIKEGEEITVSYRAMLSQSTYRYMSIPSLYDLLNDVRCMCGSAKCIHAGLTDAEILKIDPNKVLTYWCVKYETGPLKLLLAALREKKEDELAAAVAGGAADRLTQLLVLCGEALANFSSLSAFLQETKTSEDDFKTLVRECFNRSPPMFDEDVVLKLAAFQYRLFGAPKEEEICGVPCRLLQALV